jgi:nucleotide-binding universal stress UspA family protein
VLEYLSRHDVHAELHELHGTGRYAAGVLLDAAQEIGAGTMVTGAYHHSRIGEYWLGGTTPALLRQCPLALVMGR